MEKNNSDKNTQNFSCILNDSILRAPSKTIEGDNSKTEPIGSKITLTDCGKSILQRSISEKIRSSFRNRNLNKTQLVRRPAIEMVKKTRLCRSQSERPKKNPHIPISLESKARKTNFDESLSNNGLDPFDSESDNDELSPKLNEKMKQEIFYELKSMEESESDSDESNIEFYVRQMLGSNADLNFNEYFIEDLLENGLSNAGFYEKTLASRSECEICMDFCFVNERQCCNFKSCNNCINLYVQNRIKESCGNLGIECLNNECKKLIHKDEICERMLKFDKNSHDLYIKLLVDANRDANVKTCPRCSHIMDANSVQSLSDEQLKNPKKKSRLLTKCQCAKCELIWCFQCHSPWHEGVGCAEYRKGDRMLKFWAKEVHYGQQNAQMCPKCKIFIQRTKGCDHMTCSNCRSGFCYSCGKKFRSVKFIGDHYSKLSVLGCKYKLYPDKPLKRKAIRGSVLGAKIAATPFIIAVGLVVGIGVVAVGSVALPVYGSYKLYKYTKLKRKAKKKSDKSSAKNENKDNPSVNNLYPNFVNFKSRYEQNDFELDKK
ncbi:E3 ubiquitin-ligase RNF217-like [Brachionus plicatilis]|uniref:RBR-type E3 ubiquitin transferase n=1 Tax=Brachionus plicatilis TaxID=10195 RepID=A0A3M7PFC8_BRAPC|nr:E3 ubiquitin-ligase RNF217-like [Brachionus plicatilis]